MKQKIEVIIQEMDKLWGPIPYLSTDAAVRLFDQVMCATVDSHIVCKALSALFVHGLRKRNVNPSGHVSKVDALAILQAHVDLETTIYTIHGCWSHHADQEDCQGDVDLDYCEHDFHHKTVEMFDEFEKAKDYARELLDTLIDKAPKFATNAEVILEIIDGDHQVEVGKWGWDRKSQMQLWSTPERH